MFTVVAREDSQKSTAVVGSLLDELVRDGARQMLAAALQAEVAAIESTFATARLRTKVTKGPGSRMAGLAMAFKLIEAAQDRWRAVNAPHLVALVRAGATFHKGKLVERPTDQEAEIMIA